MEKLSFRFLFLLLPGRRHMLRHFWVRGREGGRDSRKFDGITAPSSLPPSLQEAGRIGKRERERERRENGPNAAPEKEGGRHHRPTARRTIAHILSPLPKGPPRPMHVRKSRKNW